MLAACSLQPKPIDTGQGPLAVDFPEEFPIACQDVLRGAAELELVAINPDWPTEASREDPATMHGYTVRGRATLTDRAQRLELLSALAAGARENDGTVAACFDPRHALRAEYQGQTYELIVCFECLSFQIWNDQGHVANGDISETPREVFDRIYAAQGLSLAPR
ncbi:MAG: hypothetical protein H6829_13875 [Planctomycetes bacterium]|nr:hypothetical protein [Planctomycetota bacterium]MCB9911507.1 hypothetical protein [Planctomycetota bacterium]